MVRLRRAARTICGADRASAAPMRRRRMTGIRVSPRGGAVCTQEAAVVSVGADVLITRDPLPMGGLARRLTRKKWAARRTAPPKGAAHLTWSATSGRKQDAGEVPAPWCL